MKAAAQRPTTIETVEQDGQGLIYPVTHRSRWCQIDHSRPGPRSIQLKTMLQGVLARGTAYRRSPTICSLFVGGKTGTSDEENDAWFAGFTNNVTVVVWVGYDNADMRQRRTLGGGRTGANIGMPIWLGRSC